jgi:transglutaminase-like putative cysteine protease
MGSREQIDPARTAIVAYGHVLSRRDFLKVTGAVGLGLVGAGLAADDGRIASAAAASAGEDAIGDLAAALDYDAERIFRFVADEIRYEPYSGILRGARGTLNSRAGNSADQALLLAALLDASLLPVRFAIGEIDSATADAILAGAQADPDAIRKHGLEALVGTIPGREVRPVDLTPEEAERLARAVADGERIATWARDQLQRTVDTIGVALEDAAVELIDGFSPLPDIERARHVWVQMAATADWVNLDPTLPGAPTGAALTRAAETLDALPEEMAHRVELALIGESIVDGTLSERALVGYSERADAIAGLPVAIMNAPPDALTALGVSVAGALGGGSSYVPVLIVGGETIVGANPIHFASGEAGGADPSEGGAAPVGGGDDFFEPGAAAGETTAQWVELTIRSPGSEPVVVRREMFDRIGPARRAAGGVSTLDLAPVERIDVAGGSTAEALPVLTRHWLTVSTGLPSRDDAVMAVVQGEDDHDGALVSQAYHQMSTAAGLDVAVPAGFRPFIDAPNVAAHSMVMRPSPSGAHALESALDIWHRSHGTMPVKGTTPVPLPAVSAGVLAHVAERVQSGDATRDPSELGGSVAVSVGAIHDAALAAGIPLMTLRGTDATAGLTWDPDARARLERALAVGRVAIAPERPVLVGDRERIGWWLVDPATGRTVDELDDGRGGSASEHTTVVSTVPLNAFPGWQRFGLCLFGATVSVASAVFFGAAMSELDAGEIATGVLMGSAGTAGTGLGLVLLEVWSC